ncbi:large conductance mechanosensitive channel protein MscL [Pseudooctadecabacter sp.]|uniref:large conductance mechanosensitive channel protein MscL n=1 Tax=Pseudooctadecabacter sp. TaxID=1966338 RepID=UPI0025D47C93|nr:large conductance mechanosensitive channel protein MscL [Pseudooctadecabacter sp.]
MIQEFKDFIAKGNVMDMAVGIIIGAAFTAIVSSLVADLINPIIALFTGGVDFSGWFYVIGGNASDYASIEAATEAGVAVFAIGRFVMAVINFLIIAFVVFLLVKMVNRVKEASEKKEEEAAEEPSGPSQEELLMEIRDALRAQN